MKTLRLVVGIVLLLTPILGWCRPSDEWVSAVITEVRRHSPASEQESDQSQWEVSLTIGKKVYVVLYTSPPGQTTIEYRAGQDLNVMVLPTKIVFHDLAGVRKEVPIIAQKPAPPPPRN